MNNLAGLFVRLDDNLSLKYTKTDLQVWGMSILEET